MKIRVWHKEEKRYIDLHSITFTSNGEIGSVRSVSSSKSITACKVVIEQSTGKACTEGCDVFKGDIVKCKFKPSDKCMPIRSFKGFVFNSSNGFVLYGIGRFSGCELLVSDSFSLRVIGNIHQNPELLEQA